MEIKVMCQFEATFEVPEGLVEGTEEFDDFVMECISSEDMLTQEVSDSGLVAIKRENFWEEV